MLNSGIHDGSWVKIRLQEFDKTYCILFVLGLNKGHSDQNAKCVLAEGLMHNTG